MRKPVLRIILYGLILSGCSSAKRPYGELKDKDLTFQAVLLEDKPEDTGLYTLRARITPDKLLFTRKTGEEKSRLIYGMDSCFYLQQGARRLLAAQVVPVAGGVSGTFDYLVSFKKETPDKTGSWSLIYQDRLLNRKTYRLQLNDQ